MRLYTPEKISNNSRTAFKNSDHRLLCKNTEETPLHLEKTIDMNHSPTPDAQVMACNSCNKTMKWRGYVISFSVYKSLWRCSCGTTVCVIDM